MGRYRIDGQTDQYECTFINAGCLPRTFLCLYARIRNHIQVFKASEATALLLVDSHRLEYKMLCAPLLQASANPSQVNLKPLDPEPRAPTLYPLDLLIFTPYNFEALS